MTSLYRVTVEVNVATNQTGYIPNINQYWVSGDTLDKALGTFKKIISFGSIVGFERVHGKLVN